jgi:hypothetical protein
VKTAENSHCTEAASALLLTQSRAVRGLKSIRGLEACSLVTASVGQFYLTCCLRGNYGVTKRCVSSGSESVLKKNEAHYRRSFNNGTGYKRQQLCLFGCGIM